MIAYTTVSQIRVEGVHVLHLWNRCRPLAFQGLHAVLNNRLLVTTRRQAEQWLEDKVTRQCCVTLIDLPLTACQHRVRHGPRVVPPDFFRHTAKELECLRHAFQNRFSPLSRQSDREGSIRIRPHQNQHVDLPASVRKVDLNLAEVRFDTLAWIVVQRNERLAFRLTMPLHKATHRIVAPLVTPDVRVLVPQPLEDPHRRVTLLRRGRLILFQDLQNPSLERPQLRSPLTRTLSIRPGLRLTPQNLSDPIPGMMKPPGNLANAHSIAMSSPYPSVIVHREHPSPPKPRTGKVRSFLRLLRWVHFQRRSATRSGSVLHAYLHDKCFGILKDGHGSHFDADVLDAFFRRTDDITEIQLRFSDRA